MAGSSIPSSLVPPILRLPTEVLFKIFFFLPTGSAREDDRVWIWDEPPTASHQSPHHPILVLRQVCRLFRAVANELDFWTDDEFDFSKLHDRFAIPTGLVEALLTDSHLVHCLEKKRTWLFRSYDVFCIVMERVLLHRVATTMRFIWVSSDIEPDFILPTDETPFPSLVYKLVVCAKLTTLQLLEVPELDFDYIPKCLSALEILSISYRWSVRNRNWLGSLQGLPRLRQLSLTNIGVFKRPGWRRTVEQNIVDPLPLSSVSTMTHLQIIGQIPGDIQYIVHSLGTFVNLTFLSLGPLSAGLARSIARVNLHLKEFHMRVAGFGSEDPDNILRILFAAPCLVGLQSLYFSYQGDGSWGQSMTYFATVEEITMNLTTLQHLRLRMQMYKSMCRSFNRLVNLKSITWVVPIFVDDQSTETDYGDEETVVQEEFDVAFRTFADKPTLNITIEDYYDDDWGGPGRDFSDYSD
jgi:hypothetical protein